jgi:hypothetical protein
VVTINNYEQYQDSNTQTNTLPTRKQHDSNTIATTDNKNKKITTKESKKIYGENVRLTLDEYNTLISRLGEAIAKNYIERLDEYLGIKDKRYKSHYKVILSWYRKDNENKPNWLAELKEEQKNADNYKHVVTKDASEVANTFKKL